MQYVISYQQLTCTHARLHGCRRFALTSRFQAFLRLATNMYPEVFRHFTVSIVLRLAIRTYLASQNRRGVVSLRSRTWAHAWIHIHQRNLGNCRHYTRNQRNSNSHPPIKTHKSISGSMRSWSFRSQDSSESPPHADSGDMVVGQTPGSMPQYQPSGFARQNPKPLFIVALSFQIRLIPVPTTIDQVPGISTMQSTAFS